MIEFFQHLFGLCPDHGSHFNLMDVLFGGFFFIPFFYNWLKARFRRGCKCSHCETKPTAEQYRLVSEEKLKAAKARFDAGKLGRYGRRR
jgi:hypothetical protein